ncbi:MAG: MerR family transcriptional regulator [Actinomycetota bacterium]|nr:MerR family transcriptional regulator [Actinomycetota bacterium]
MLKIGELAQLMGVEAATIRNYEQQSLLKPAARSETGQHRLYGQEEVARAQFIKRAKLFGLPLAEIKELLALVAQGERGEDIPRLKEVLEEKLRKTDRRMEELTAFRDSLLHYRWRFGPEEDEG